MSALLERAEQAVSVTDIARKAKVLFSELSGAGRYVVMKNNKPAGVVLSVEYFQGMLDELADLRIERVAAERLRTLDSNKTISLAEMKKAFGVDDEYAAEERVES